MKSTVGPDRETLKADYDDENKASRGGSRTSLVTSIWFYRVSRGISSSLAELLFIVFSRVHCLLT